MKTRREALELLNQYVESESLKAHCYAVEGAMRQYANLFGQDEETWGIAGLLHDLDFEKYPETHPLKGAKIIEEEGYPIEMVEAIKAHNDALGLPRNTQLAKTLFAVDGLSSFIIAYVLVRPDQSFEGIQVKSIKKKLKDKAFAKGVDREMVTKGIEELGIETSEHIQNVIDGIVNHQIKLKEMGLSLI